MKIKLLVSRAGMDFSQNAGDVIETDDAEAIRLIEAGQAVPFVEQVAETATAKPVRERRGG